MQKYWNALSMEEDDLLRGEDALYAGCDGYAFRSADTVNASGKTPVTLYMIDIVPEGGKSAVACTKNTVIKVPEGAPIPEGADAVVACAQVEAADSTVRLYSPVECGANIVCTDMQFDEL